MDYQDIIINTIYTVIDFCKNCVVWSGVTLWQVMTGLLVTNGIVSAFQFGREFYEIRKRDD